MYAFTAAIIGAGLIFAGGANAILPAKALAAQPMIGFKQQVMPILQQHCTVCHSPGGVGFKAIGLDLEGYKQLMSGSTFGTAVIPYHPELSPLVQVLKPNGHSFKDLRMPPVGTLLTPSEVRVISTWIRQGAKNN